MKKRISILLSFVMLLVLAFPASAFAADYSGVQTTGDKVMAQYTETAIDVNALISEATWGAPTVKLYAWGSSNTGVFNYDGEVKCATEFDVYFRWDNTNLYVGVVGDDEDHVGANVDGDHDEWWTGDGVQMWFQVGNERKTCGFVLASNGTGTTTSSALVQAARVQFSNNKMYAAAAIPLAELGVTNVREGVSISFDMIRIDGNSSKPYAGWVYWGACFGNDSPNNVNATGHNVIILNKSNPAPLSATKVETAPDITSTADTNWGTKLVTVTKDSALAQLYWQPDRWELDKTSNTGKEDITMDVYAVWTDTDLYIRLVSPDANLSGGTGAWNGDGFQCKFFSIKDSSSSRIRDLDISVGFINNGTVAGESDNAKLLNKDGKFYMQAKLPLSKLGIEAREGSIAYGTFARNNDFAEQGSYVNALQFGSVFGGNARQSNRLTKYDVVEIKLAAAAPVVPTDPTPTPPAPTPTQNPGQNPGQPETGDTFSVVLFVVLMLAAVAGIAYTLKKRNVDVK